MSFDRLKSDGTPGGTTRESTPSEGRAVMGEELWIPPGGSAGVVVTERTALQYAAMLATLNTVATDVAVLPLEIYQRLQDDSRRLAREHRNYELLARSPNGGESTPLKWRQALMGHALEYGNGYAEIQRTGRGAPFGLHLLDPEVTKAKRVAGKLLYQLGDGRFLAPSNVLHVAGFGYDGVNGYSFVRLMRQALGVGMAAEGFAADYFLNGSEPGGVLEVPNRLEEEGRRNLRESWEWKQKGQGNRHRIAVLEQGTKFTPTTGDPAKSQLVEQRRFQVNDSVRPWRVPPNKIGDMSEAHLSNIEASNLDYLMSCLLGWLVGIEQEWDLKLFTRNEWLAGYYVKHDLSALLRVDILTRYKAHEIAIRNGWMSRDEIRRRENLAPMGPDRGGDLYTVQSQNIPLEMAGKVKTPPMPPGTSAGDGSKPDDGTEDDGKQGD